MLVLDFFYFFKYVEMVILQIELLSMNEHNFVIKS